MGPQLDAPVVDLDVEFDFLSLVFLEHTWSALVELTARHHHKYSHLGWTHVPIKLQHSDCVSQVLQATAQQHLAPADSVLNLYCAAGGGHTQSPILRNVGLCALRLAVRTDSTSHCDVDVQSRLLLCMISAWSVRKQSLD